MQEELVAGDSLNFPKSTPGYPDSAGWVLTYILVPRTVGGSTISIAATAEGDDHRVALAATTTAAWAAGNYSWSARVEKSGEKYTVSRGQTVIRPDMTSVAAGYDGRSVAEKALADAKAAFSAWTPTTRRYRIADREHEFSSKAEIVGSIEFWQIELKREQRASALAKGMPDPSKSFVRINRE